MGNLIWFAVVAFIVWLLNNALSGLFVEWAKSSFKWLLKRLGIRRSKHRLRLSVDNAPDCVLESEVDWGNGEGTIPRKFLRVRLFNDAAATIPQCEVWLIHIYQMILFDRVSIGYDNPRPLWWNECGKGGEQYSPRDFSPGGPYFVDVLYTRYKNNRNQIVLKDKSYTKVNIEFGRIYRFTVQTRESAGDAHTLEFDVKFGTSYKEIEVLSVRTI